MIIEIDIERLRDDLIDYFGTLGVNVSFGGFMEVSRIENMDPQELVDLAKENNFDLLKYRA